MSDAKAEINEAEPVVEKTEKQKEKEAKKAAKTAKFLEKKTKVAETKPAAPKEKVEVNFIKISQICSWLLKLHMFHEINFFIFPLTSYSFIHLLIFIYFFF